MDTFETTKTLAQVFLGITMLGENMLVKELKGSRQAPEIICLTSLAIALKSLLLALLLFMGEYCSIIAFSAIKFGFELCPQFGFELCSSFGFELCSRFGFELCSVLVLNET
ncbi:uncharacterized [Tachysurus ichikawai]